MAIIENASSPEAVAAWFAKFGSMDRSEMVAQQICQRGAEHVLMTLQEIGVTPENVQDMLDSLRHALITLHEAATARGIELMDYSYDEPAAAEIGKSMPDGSGGV